MMLPVRTLAPNQPNPATPFTSIGKEHKSLKLFKQGSAALGSLVGGAVGTVDGFVRGAAADVLTPAGRAELGRAAFCGARVGAVAGALVGAAVGALGAGPLGAVIVGAMGAAAGGFAGAVAGGLGKLALDGAAAVPASASAAWTRGHEVGQNAASAIVRAQTLGIVWVGDHVPGAHRIGLFITRLGQEEPKGADFQRVHQVDTKIFRSAQPGPDVWPDLAAQGYKSVVNLRWEENYEESAVKAAGMKTLYLPESPLKAPTIDQALEFLKFVTDPSNQPVLFHCYSGVDRTGTMAACYRIAVQGWTQERALNEALELGMVAELQADKIRFIKQFNTAWMDMKSRGVAPHFPQPTP